MTNTLIRISENQYKCPYCDKIWPTPKTNRVISERPLDSEAREAANREVENCPHLLTDPNTGSTRSITMEGHDYPCRRRWTDAYLAFAEEKQMSDIGELPMSEIDQLAPVSADNLNTIVIRKSRLRVFWDIADDFDDTVEESHVIIDKWVEDDNYSHFAMVLGSVTKAFIAVGQSFVDVLRIGQGVQEGGWGYGKDALRILTLASGAGAVVGRTSRIIAVTQTARSGQVCTLVSTSRALRAAGQRFYVSLKQLAKSAGLNLDDIVGTGTTVGGTKKLADALRAMGIKVRELTISTNKLDELVTLGRSNPNGVIHFSILKAGGGGHRLCAQWKNGVLVIEDTTGKIYNGIKALQKVYPQATLRPSVPTLFIPNSWLIPASHIADVGALAQVGLELRRLTYEEYSEKEGKYLTPITPAAGEDPHPDRDDGGPRDGGPMDSRRPGGAPGPERQGGD